MSIWNRFIIWLAGGEDEIKEIERLAKFISDVEAHGGEVVISDKGGIAIKGVGKEYFNLGENDEQTIKNIIRDNKR